MEIEPFKLHTAAAWARLEPPRWLVSNFLFEQCLAVIFGASGCGKSFLTSHVAHIVAGGLNWTDGAVDPATVIYLAAENPGSLAPRFAALEAHLGGPFPSLFLVADEINLIAENFAAKIGATIALAEKQTGSRVGLLIIDTMRDAWPGNEDSSTEVSRAFAPLKAIRDRHKLCVLLVHHAGHNGERERGSSHIRANADIVWQVEERGNQRVVSCLKMRDAAKPEAFAFTLDPADDSCVVNFAETAPTPQRQRPLSGQHKIALDALSDRVSMIGEPLPSHIGVNAYGVPCSEWRQEFYSRLGDTKTDAKCKAFQRALAELQARSLVGVHGDYTWRV